MTIFGKRPSEYVAFSRLFLGVILVVGVTRLALSLAGVPNSIATWFSLTAVLWIGLLYYSIRVHTSGFGSYKQLLAVLVTLNLLAEAIIIAGIILAIVTGVDNIYSAPEYSFGSDGKSWLHVGAHMVLGTTVAPLMAWLVGCAIMFATKRLTTRDKGAETARA